jgi:hypothetical protein
MVWYARAEIKIVLGIAIYFQIPKEHQPPAGAVAQAHRLRRGVRG